MNDGWKCPECNIVWAPHVKKCENLHVNIDDLIPDLEPDSFGEWRTPKIWGINEAKNA